jgi:hypothetical protein
MECDGGHRYGPLCSTGGIRSARGLIRRIDDARVIRIQSPQSIDERTGFGRAVHTGITHWVVPDQGGNVRLKEECSDRRCTGVECELCPSSEVKHSLFRICWRWVRVDERPTAIKNCLPELGREVERRQIRGAKGRDKQDKLQVRHSRILNIKGCHRAPLFGRDEE